VVVVVVVPGSELQRHTGPEDTFLICPWEAQKLTLQQQEAPPPRRARSDVRRLRGPGARRVGKEPACTQGGSLDTWRGLGSSTWPAGRCVYARTYSPSCACKRRRDLRDSPDPERDTECTRTKKNKRKKSRDPKAIHIAVAADGG